MSTARSTRPTDVRNGVSAPNRGSQSNLTANSRSSSEPSRKLGNSRATSKPDNSPLSMARPRRHPECTPAATPMRVERVSEVPISSRVHGRRRAISEVTVALVATERPRSPWARSRTYCTNCSFIGLSTP